MIRVETFVVVTGSGRLYGPFDTAEKAATFLTENYAHFAGHSRIECVWNTEIWDEHAKRMTKAA